MQGAEIKKYTKLNELAEQGGIVIFGCTEDKNIPTCELRQAFTLESRIYNRSFEELSIKDAVRVYEESIAPLAPETVLIHLGEADQAFFAESPAAFDQTYRELIGSIRTQNKKCRICIVSLRNCSNTPLREEMNKHLRYIAESERCDYGDIATTKVWNPKATTNVASFVHSISFTHPLKNKCPVYDLVKIMFGYDM